MNELESLAEIIKSNINKKIYSDFFTDKKNNKSFFITLRDLVLKVLPEDNKNIDAELLKNNLYKIQEKVQKNCTLSKILELPSSHEGVDFSKSVLVHKNALNFCREENMPAFLETLQQIAGSTLGLSKIGYENMDPTGKTQFSHCRNISSNLNLNLIIRHHKSDIVVYDVINDHLEKNSPIPKETILRLKQSEIEFKESNAKNFSAYNFGNNGTPDLCSEGEENNLIVHINNKNSTNKKK